MILVIDHHDSFVENLARLVREVGIDNGVKTKIISQDAPLAEALAVNPTALILSPGPGTPATSGISADLVNHYKDKIPILGVCLGHLIIANNNEEENITAAREPQHGKQAEINHNNHPLFRGLPNPFCAGLYHSLAIKQAPPEFETIATHSGEIMAIAHKHAPIFGVQFHPESILTQTGGQIINNFLEYVR